MANALSLRANALLSSLVAIEAEQVKLAEAQGTEADRIHAELADKACAIMDEINGIDDHSGNPDLTAARLLVPIMLEHSWPRRHVPGFTLHAVETEIRVLSAVAGATTGAIREHAVFALKLAGIDIPDASTDPCLAFVSDWNAALAAYGGTFKDHGTAEGDLARWEAEVAPFFHKANNSDVPAATTAEGAAAALRRVLAWEDIENAHDVTLIRAALAYLDAGGRLTAPVEPDPLLEIVQRYRAQLAEFNKITGKTDEEANAIRDATWGPFEDGVADGSIILPSPTTLIGAAAALRCALEEDTTHAVSDKMRDVALAFLEAEGIQ